MDPHLDVEPLEAGSGVVENDPNDFHNDHDLVDDNDVKNDGNGEEEPEQSEKTKADNSACLMAPKRGKKSKYWVHYMQYNLTEHPNKRDVARCDLCFTDIKCNKGTGGLRKHLYYKHPQEYEDVENMEGYPSDLEGEGDGAAEEDYVEDKEWIENPTLLPPKGRKKSKYWIHYMEYDLEVHPGKKNVARCSICARDIKCNQGTGGLRNHLRNKHPNHFDKLDEICELFKNKSDAAHAAGESARIGEITLAVRNLYKAGEVAQIHPPKHLFDEPKTKKMRRSLAEDLRAKKSEEKRQEEKHWMEMWTAARNEMKVLRQELREEDDEEVIAEIRSDLRGLRKRKAELAGLLGMDEEYQATPRKSVGEPLEVVDDEMTNEVLKVEVEPEEGNVEQQTV